jgi:hypothetical protein
MSRVPTDVVGGEDLVLTGIVFEVGRAFYHGKLPTGLSAEVPAEPTAVTHALGQAPYPSVLASLGTWTRGCARRRIPGSIGGTGSISSSAPPGGLPRSCRGPISWITSCFPSPMRAFFDLVLQVPKGMRECSQHHVDLIRRLAPALAVFPFNPPAPLHRRLLRAARVRWRRWRGHAGNGRRRSGLGEA